MSYFPHKFMYRVSTRKSIYIFDIFQNALEIPTAHLLGEGLTIACQDMGVHCAMEMRNAHPFPLLIATLQLEMQLLGPA